MSVRVGQGLPDFRVQTYHVAMPPPRGDSKRRRFEPSPGWKSEGTRTLYMLEVNRLEQILGFDPRVVSSILTPPASFNKSPSLKKNGRRGCCSRQNTLGAQRDCGSNPRGLAIQNAAIADVVIATV